MWGLRGGFLDPFCYSDDPHVEVVEDPALLAEFTVQARCAGLGFLELFAEIFVGFLDVLPDSGLAAEGLPDHEAKGSRYQHP